jgi:hypothetical protein
MKGSISYTHNGKPVVFHCEPNMLNLNIMYWFSGSHAMYAGTKREVKRIARQLASKQSAVVRGLKL